MGLFDTVNCEYRMPNPAHQDLEFQTKDLECLLDRYVITRDGRLIRRGSELRGLERDVEWPFHGDLCIYAGDPENRERLVEYVVRFTHGRVEWIRRLDEITDERVGGTPAPPLTPDRPAEQGLLETLRARQRELKTLFEECSSHWGFEDPVYRFYHQSFKVYLLQAQTKAIVSLLASLAPDRPLNPWFLEIVEAGTGKDFKPEDNAEWTRVTRPILEAFFHARFFLEMAVRYEELEAPPSPLPSGYAALLYLYGLR